MAAILRFEAMLNIGNAKKSASHGVPAQQPLGYSRPQTATFATSGALAYGNSLLSAAVRKLPVHAEKVDTEELLGSFLGKREKSDSGRPVFRSALEQVSYETNSSLSEAPVKSQRQSIAGRISRAFRK